MNHGRKILKILMLFRKVMLLLTFMNSFPLMSSLFCVEFIPFEIFLLSQIPRWMETTGGPSRVMVMGGPRGLLGVYYHILSN